MADKKELNSDQMNRVAGGTCVYKPGDANEEGKFLVYTKNRFGEDVCIEEFDKFHAKEAMAFDKAINGPNSGFIGLWTEAK